MAKKRLWSFSPKAPRGYSVLAFLDEGDPSIVLEYRVRGKRKSLSLGHKDRKKAEREAKEFVATRITAAKLPPKPDPVVVDTREDLTLGALKALYLSSEYQKTLTAQQQRVNRSKLGLWERHLGPEKLVKTLDEEAVLGFCNARRKGRGLPRAEGQQTLYNDFSTLRGALRWAMRTKNEAGRLYLTEYPLFGVVVETEKNPHTEIITHKTFTTLRKASKTFTNEALRVFLVTAEGTGQRENAIRLLRWQDIDFEQGGIWWQDEVEVEGAAVRADKGGYRDFLAASPRVMAVLKRWRQQNPETEWVFQSPKGVRPYALSWVTKWSAQLFEAAGMKKPKGSGWHAFRRKMATELDMAGESIAAIQSVTRHRSTAALMRYIKRDRGDARRLVSNARKRL